MSEEEKKKKVTLTPQELAELLTNTVQKTIASAQGKTSDSTLAGQPFKKTVGERDAEKYASLISRPKAGSSAKKAMQFLKTGTYLDKLFFNEEDEPSGGIPLTVQLGVVGLPDTGKSILVQEIALAVASGGKKVIFVTSEDVWDSPSLRFDLQSRMKQKADIMGLDWEDIRHNIFVFDAISQTEFRDWDTFVEAYRYLVETLKGIDLLIVDSITLMQSYRGALKYRLMELARFNQLNGVTAIYVCQRSVEEADKYAMAGGIGLAHNLDATLCIDKKKAVSQLKADLNRNRPKDAQIKQWEEVQFTRMMGCRLSGFDRRYFEVEITNNGFLKIKQ